MELFCGILKRVCKKMWSVMFEGIRTCEENVQKIWWMSESLGSVTIISEAEMGVTS